MSIHGVFEEDFSRRQIVEIGTHGDDSAVNGNRRFRPRARPSFRTKQMRHRSLMRSQSKLAETVKKEKNG